MHSNESDDDLDVDTQGVPLVTKTQTSKRHSVPDFYGVYLLRSKPKPKSFYIGSTPNPDRRLKQHNGELVSGAYRTKRDGFRPWDMIVVVSGFPSKISALQFEHAFQHPHITRHITGERVSTTARSGKNSLPALLANLRLLLSSKYFSALDLVVNITDADAIKVWNKNHKHIDTENRMVQYSDFAEFTERIQKHTEGTEMYFIEAKERLLGVQPCMECSQDIDLMPDSPATGCGPLVTMTPCCSNIYHLACIGKSLLPKKIKCNECGTDIEWLTLVSIATKIRDHFQ